VHIRTLGEKPIVIGHSFGGLIAQRLLGENVAAAAVAIDPAPPKGVLFLPLSALRVAGVALRNPANWSRAVALTTKQFRFGFANAVSERESSELYERWAIRSPGRPLFEASMATFVPGSPAKVDTKNATHGPLLITAGGKDHTVPRVVSKQTLALAGDHRLQGAPRPRSLAHSRQRLARGRRRRARLASRQRALSYAPPVPRTGSAMLGIDGSSVRSLSSPR
jgi:pimeloyl-ACP methyl ester carboxylesterase